MAPWSAPYPPLPEWLPHKKQETPKVKLTSLTESSGTSEVVFLVIGNGLQGALGLAPGCIASPLRIMLGARGRLKVTPSKDPRMIS